MEGVEKAEPPSGQDFCAGCHPKCWMGTDSWSAYIPRRRRVLLLSCCPQTQTLLTISYYMVSEGQGGDSILGSHAPEFLFQTSLIYYEAPWWGVGQGWGRGGVVTGYRVGFGHTRREERALKVQEGIQAASRGPSQIQGLGPGRCVAQDECGPWHHAPRHLLTEMDTTPDQRGRGQHGCSGVPGAPLLCHGEFWGGGPGTGVGLWGGCT